MMIIKYDHNYYIYIVYTYVICLIDNQKESDL
jgi:hypothetical protein